jgi:hypothetical protein
VQTGHGAEFGASDLAEGHSPAPPATSRDASLDIRRDPTAGHFIKTKASCNTFLWCVLRKFWGGVSCLCLALLVYFLESVSWRCVCSCAVARLLRLAGVSAEVKKGGRQRPVARLRLHRQACGWALRTQKSSCRDHQDNPRERLDRRRKGGALA